VSVEKPSTALKADITLLCISGNAFCFRFELTGRGNDRCWADPKIRDVVFTTEEEGEAHYRGRG